MSEEIKRKKRLDEYNESMETADVREFLGIGRDQAYALMASGEFHVVKCGRRKFVAREVFKEWFYGK